MFTCTIQQFCEITGSQNVGVSGSRSVNHAVIDSRQAGPGALFFALPGSRTHGIEFARPATAAGAVVVADEQSANLFDGPVIVASDPQQALQQLAGFNRRQSDALVVGITGSVGKTTTRRLLTSVLEAGHVGVQSPANYNNELGVPLSLLQIQDDTEFAVIEMGAGRPGDINELCRIVRPEFAIVTAVAPAHLSAFGSVDAIAVAKQEIVESLGRDGTVFLNVDDPRVSAMAPAAGCRVVTFGQSGQADLRYEVVDVANDRLVLRVEGHDYGVRICGEHQAVAVAASIAVGRELDLALQTIQQGLDQFQPAPGRAVVQTINGIEVIDDSYNANPASVEAAVRLLDQWRTGGRRVLVLGDMLDLGDQASELHFSMGQLIARTNIGHTVAFGSHAADMAAGFLSAGGCISRISVFEQQATLQALLDCLIGPGDVVLVKGSRGMAMERFVADLQVSPPAALKRAA